MEKYYLTGAQKELIMDAFNGSVKPTETNKIALDYLISGISDNYQKIFKEPCSYLQSRLIRDNAVDEVANMIDYTKPYKMVSIIELLSNALKAYARGDQEPLTELYNTTLLLKENFEDATEKVLEEPYQPDLDAELAESPDASDEEDNLEDIGIDEDLGVEDALHISAYLLNKTNKISDSLKKTKFTRNLHIRDNVIQEPVYKETPVPNPILSRDEFYSVAFDELPLTFIPKSLPSNVDGIDIIGKTLVTGKNTPFPEDYYILGDVQTFKEALDNAEDKAKFIANSCRPASRVRDFIKQSNSLHLLDQNFYKKDLTKPYYSLDEAVEGIPSNVTKETKFCTYPIGEPFDFKGITIYYE